MAICKTMKFLFLATMLGLAFSGSIKNAKDFIDSSPSPEGKLWAVLVAGSRSYFNYRHQADVCHAYQVLHAHGVPDERIVVMMYDDIAYDPENPTPGVILNHPDGDNVYAGVPKDYTGKDVTPKNFLSVLQGDIESVKGIGSGKVVHSGPDDRIFVYFSDHGAPGLIVFPQDQLYAEDLNVAIRDMHTNGRYSKMLFYVEACESGSMFDGLLSNDSNVFATTASTPYESSFACYYDSTRQTYLGDVYSVKWMEDSDRELLTEETLEEQYARVKQETQTSNVMQYGDTEMGRLKVSEFQAGADAERRRTPGRLLLKPLSKVSIDAVSSRDVPLAIWQKKLVAAADIDVRNSLRREVDNFIRSRKFLEEKVLEIVRTVAAAATPPHVIIDFKSFMKLKWSLEDRRCYRTLVEYFDLRCFDLSENSYALSYLYVFVNMCEYGIWVQRVKLAMDQVCTQSAVNGIL